MDYRELLKKYISFIGSCEGIDFLEFYDHEKILNEEELNELNKLASEIQEELTK